MRQNKKKQIEDFNSILTDSSILHFIDKNDCLIVGDKDDVIYALRMRLREMQNEVGENDDRPSSSTFGFNYAKDNYYDYYIRSLLDEFGYYNNYHLTVEEKLHADKEITDLLNSVVNRQFYCKRDEIALNNDYSITQAEYILKLIKKNQNTLFNSDNMLNNQIDDNLQELLTDFCVWAPDDEDWNAQDIYVDEEDLAKYFYREIERVIEIKYISLLKVEDIIIEEDNISTKKYEISYCNNISSSVIDFILDIIALKEENKEKDEDEYIPALIKKYILKNINKKGYFWHKNYFFAYGNELRKHTPRGKEKIYDSKLYIWDSHSYSSDTYSIIEDLDGFIKEYFLI